MKQRGLFLAGILSMALVFVFALAGCASTSAKLVTSFEEAMARNDLSGMETILQESAKEMDLDKCMADVVGRFINGLS